MRRTADLAGLLLLVLVGGATAAVAQREPAPSEAPGSIAAGEAALAAELGQLAAPVALDGRTLFRVRGATSYPAAERARAIAERIAQVARTPSIAPEAVKAVPADALLNVVAADVFLVAVTELDARYEGIDRATLGELYAQRIAQAVRAYREARTPQAMLHGTRRSLVATVLLLAGAFVLIRSSRGLEAKLGRRYEERLRSVQFQSFEIVRAQRLRDALRWLVRALRATLVAVLLYLWLDFVLGSFAVTRPVADRLLGFVLDPLARLGADFLEQLPNLAFLLVLYVIVRWLLRVTRLFFEAVEKGHVTLSGFEPEWAVPTFRVVRVVAIVLALVVAYPYIPGSGSAAFQGLSILFGVMLSIGSSSFIANIIAGYSMIYRRAFRVGDRIQVGEVIGDVTSIRLQVTHVRSLKNEEVVIPNATLLGTNVVNYSTLARSHGLILHTTVGIGYETPWRQVEAMLLLAAERTEGLLREPAPFVLQKSLGDFCVVYELNIYCDAPAQMTQLYTRLHRAILDVFNEYGVQIMTPAYEGDPAVPKVVKKEDWWVAPARPAGEPGATGAGGGSPAGRP